MKTLILFFLPIIALAGCTTTASTRVQRDEVTGEELYKNPTDRLIYADVVGKGSGSVSKSIKFDPLTGDIVEYTISVQPSSGLQSASKNLASFGGSIAGKAVEAFEVVVPVD